MGLAWWPHQSRFLACWSPCTPTSGATLLTLLRVCLQRVVAWAFAQGWGLSACWFSTATFMALRLCMNSARLLGPGSVLSRTEPLSDNRKELEAKARDLATAAGSPLTDSESDSEADGPGSAAPPSDSPERQAAAAAVAAAAGAVAFKGLHGRPGGRGRGDWLASMAVESTSDSDDASTDSSGSEIDVMGGLGRPGGRGRGGGDGVGDVFNAGETVSSGS